MCIISHKVVSVNTTKLFLLLSQDRKRQLVVYSNTVNTSQNNVMILPIPTPDSVVFEKVPKEIFHQASISFPTTPTWSRNDYMLSYSRTNPIVIQSHGSYDVAVVPSKKDFGSIPETFVTLSDEVKRFLMSNYDYSYGFLLCKLKPGIVKYEPFAYSYEIKDNTLFLPTKHFHIDPDFVSGRSSNPKVTADWDHEIYLCGLPKLSFPNEKVKYSGDNEIEWDEMPKNFNVGPFAPLQKIVRKGSTYPKVDMELKFI